MKIAIVSPCHIPLTKEWVEKLERERLYALKVGVIECDVIIVDDSNGNLGQLPVQWRIYDYPRQEEFLGELYTQFAAMFHKSSACRIFGHILAYSEGYDVVIGLDSDCEVRENFVGLHLEALQQKGWGWTNPLQNLPGHYYPRGFPYHMRDWPVVANMGMWEQCLDLNGKDRRENEATTVGVDINEYDIAVAPLPFSGMNFALAREAVPGFLFFPNFDYPGTLTDLMGTDGTPVVDKFRRIDDIWGGYIFQKLAKIKRQAISFGHPLVDHISKVIPEEDAAEEAAMYKWEELFLSEVDKSIDIAPENLSYIYLYNMFVSKFSVPELSYEKKVFNNVLPALNWWVQVWDKYGK